MKILFVNKNRPIVTQNQKVHIISNVQSSSIYSSMMSLHMQDVIQIKNSKRNFSNLFHGHIRTKKIF